MTKFIEVTTQLGYKITLPINMIVGIFEGTLCTNKEGCTFIMDCRKFAQTLYELKNPYVETRDLVIQIKNPTSRGE